MGTVTLQRLSGDTGIMRPFVALSVILAAACGAPTAPLLAGGYAAAPYAGAVVNGAVTQSVGPAPAGHGLSATGPVVPIPNAPYVAPPAPAPYTTAAQGVGTTTVHQPAPIVTKQVHLGQTSYVSAYNAPIITEQAEVHNVQTPVLVERKVNIPYDVPVFKDNIVSVPVPVNVDAPYNVPVPVAVPGEPIIKKSVAPAVVTHSNHVAHAGVTSSVQAAPVVNAAAYTGAYAAAPALLH